MNITRPGQRAMSEFLCRIIGPERISREDWIEGIEHLKTFILAEVFPQITLKILAEHEFVKMDKPARQGSLELFAQQGFFHTEENSGENVLWGLTRNGKWVKGYVEYSVSASGIQAVFIAECRIEELVDHSMVGPAVIAQRLDSFIEEQKIARYREHQELAAAQHAIATFAGILRVRFEQTKAFSHS